MKPILAAALLAFACAPAFAIDISEGTVNAFVARKLAERRQRDVQVLDPKIRLRDGYATLCATLRARAVSGNVDFCADMTPKWRRETGSLLASRMALVSLSAPGMREADVELLKSLINQIVLPRLEGAEIYRADDLAGGQISEVRVLPGRLDVSM